MRVLLVEPDAAASQSIDLMLKAEGFVVQTTDAGEEALDCAKIYDYDVIVTDLDLPDLDGYAMLRAMRASKIATPVLVVSGDCGVSDKVKAFRLGADDFLDKPFHKDELVARLHAIVRRTRNISQSAILIDDLTLDLANKTVTAPSGRVHLTSREYGMLELLALRKGIVVTREVILNHLYGGMDEPEIKIIDVFMCKLRRKLAAVSENANLIETVWGRGYVLRERGAELAA